MRNTSCFALAASCVLAALTARSAEELRLSGTMSLGNGQWLALVEMPEQRQQLARVGDRVGNGTIVAIGDRNVRVRFVEGERLYVLESGKTIAVWNSVAAADAPIVISREAPHDLPQRLAVLRDKSGTLPPDLFRKELNSTLGLPPGTRIRQVDRKAIGSDAEALSRIYRDLKTGRLCHLFLDGTKDLNEVYLLVQQTKPKT